MGNENKKFKPPCIFHANERCMNSCPLYRAVTTASEHLADQYNMSEEALLGTEALHYSVQDAAHAARDIYQEIPKAELLAQLCSRNRETKSA